jgi:hypothetical protein
VAISPGQVLHAVIITQKVNAQVAVSQEEEKAACFAPMTGRQARKVNVITMGIMTIPE